MIDANDYQFLSALLRDHCGLALGAGKEYLLESRLPAVCATFGLSSLEELIGLLRDNPHHDLVKAVCGAMMTGETLFFRDGAPFDFLRTTVLPELAARCRATNTPLRIWSAAASTGQEPYSIAMLVEDLAAQPECLLAGVRVDIFATDYVPQVLNRARRGVYSEIEILRGLPPAALDKYFTRTAEGYRLHDSIRRRVLFGELNLLYPFTALGKFDIILCRNVLLYFDAVTKKDVMERMAEALLPGGYFFLGATETSFAVTDRLVRLPSAPTPVLIRGDDARNPRSHQTDTLRLPSRGLDRI